MEGDFWGLLVGLLLLAQGLVMLIAGKTFFIGADKYSKEVMITFSKKASFSVILMGIGLLVFHFGLSTNPFTIWMFAVGGIMAVIGIVIYVIMAKKYLKKEQ